MRKRIFFLVSDNNTHFLKSEMFVRVEVFFLEEINALCS